MANKIVTDRKPLKKHTSHGQQVPLEDALPFAAAAPAAAESQPALDNLKSAVVAGADAQPPNRWAARSHQGVKARDLLPDTEQARGILKQRALSMAQLKADAEDINNHQEFLRFRLGDTEEYGIAYGHLDEILYVPTITSVPCTPAHIAGVVNRRGEMLTVMQLQPFFNTRDIAKGSEARIIVVSGQGMRVGILVDEVISNERYAPEQLAPALASAGVANLDYVKGIYGGRVTLLNMDALLADDALRVETP